MRTLNIATANRANSPIWKNISVKWTDLVEQLSKPHITHETYASYMAMPKAEQDRIKDVGGYVGGYLEGGKRKNTNLTSRGLLTLDIDFGSEAFISSFNMLYNWEAVIHSTHKHSYNTVRLRLIMPLSRDCSPEEYEAVARRVAGDIGIHIFDPTTFQPVRMMFWPSRAKDGEWIFKHIEGEPVDVDSVLASYVNWRDISEWAYHDSVTPTTKNGNSKQEDPTTKKGIVGVFCRAYTIHDAISEFLSDVYEPTTDDNRYTFKGGSTAAGAVVYDDKWLFSNHGTDPVSGILCNAFDLVRIHKFGYEDKDSKDTGATAKSYKAMRQWALTLDPIKTLSVEESLEDTHFVDTAQVDENEWIKLLELDDHAKPKSSIFNVRMVLQYDPNLKGRLKYNSFDNKRYLVADLGDHKVRYTEIIRDPDYSYIRGYLESTYGIVGVAKIDDAISLEFQRNSWHPIQEYLLSLEWDGEVRLTTLLQKVLGASDSIYVREVLRAWMTAAVARVFEPGCKFDEMLVLVGPQGTGKSTFLRALGKQWFSDSFSTVSGKESFEQLQGSWIMEIAELSAFRKADAEMVKHFIAKQFDRYRPSYGRTIEDYQRQVVFAGTTNEQTFLTDVQNRRYWPVVNNPEKAEFTVWDSRFTDYIDQFWAEAVYYYFNDRKMILSKVAEETVNDLREDHRLSDNRKGIVEDYLDQLLPEDWDERDLAERKAWLANTELRNSGTIRRTKVCTMEIWCECLGKSREEASRYNTKDVNDIMRSLPEWELKPGIQSKSFYGRQRCYERV